MKLIYYTILFTFFWGVPNSVVAGFDLPEDEIFQIPLRRWHLDNAKVIEAWQYMEGFGSSDSVVAVIDEGFDIGSPARPSGVLPTGPIIRFPPQPIPHWDPAPLTPIHRQQHDMGPELFSLFNSQLKDAKDQPVSIEISSSATWNFDIEASERHVTFPISREFLRFHTRDRLHDYLTYEIPRVLAFDIGHPDLVDWRGCFKIEGRYIYREENAKIIAPWDFIRNNHDPRPDLEAQGLHGSTNPTDYAHLVLNHGTFVSSIAVGRVGGGKIVGAAPNAKLMPIRANVRSDGYNGDENKIAEWFSYAADNGADVIVTNFIRRPPIKENGILYKAIEKCATRGRNGKGCVIVEGAGHNNGDINDPDNGNTLATHPNIIAVAASTILDKRSDDPKTEASNFGERISICAPGKGIASATVQGYGMDFLGLDKSYGVYSSTSPASALVGGIAALILSVNPNLTSSQVKDILQQTARKIGDKTDSTGHYIDSTTGQPEYDSTGHSVHFGYGCVDAEAAVRRAHQLSLYDTVVRVPHPNPNFPLPFQWYWPVNVQK